MFAPLSAAQGVVVVGYGSGHIRLFSLEDGHIMCEVSSSHLSYEFNNFFKDS